MEFNDTILIDNDVSWYHDTGELIVDCPLRMRYHGEGVAGGITESLRLFARMSPADGHDGDLRAVLIPCQRSLM